MDLLLSARALPRTGAADPGARSRSGWVASQTARWSSCHSARDDTGSAYVLAQPVCVERRLVARSGGLELGRRICCEEVVNRHRPKPPDLGDALRAAERQLRDERAPALTMRLREDYPTAVDTHRRRGLQRSRLFLERTEMSSCTRHPACNIRRIPQGMSCQAGIAPDNRHPQWCSILRHCNA